MPKPLKYQFSSDYATLANDSDTTTITVSIPEQTADNGTIYSFSEEATVGTAGSPIEYDVNYSVSSRRWKTPQFFYVENASTANQYIGLVTVYKSGASTVKVLVTVYYSGPNASVTTTARTVTVRVRTFIPPF